MSRHSYADPDPELFPFCEAVKNVVAKSFLAPRLLQPDPDIILYVFPCTIFENVTTLLVDESQELLPITSITSPLSSGAIKT